MSMQYKYTVNHNGVTCVLPAFTRSVKRKMDEVNARISDEGATLDDWLDAMHAYLTETVGEENLARMLGSSSADEIDLNDMYLLYIRIAKAYDKPVEDATKPELDPATKKILQEIAGAARNVDYIQRAAKPPAANPAMPVFRP